MDNNPNFYFTIEFINFTDNKKEIKIKMGIANSKVRISVNGFQGITLLLISNLNKLKSNVKMTKKLNVFAMFFVIIYLS